ncbi:MAG: hypothetical protein QG575_1068, partial [Euryarchaeota archaeon]|nr:hypothetical protein [Euryarchaeota archaeon]
MNYNIGIETMNNELDLGRLIQSLDSRDRQVHKKAIEDLANSDPIPKELFIKLLVDKSDNIRSGIEDVLIKIGKPVVSSLILSLKSESRDLRMRSAKVLGKMLDPDAIEPLSI